MDLNNFILKFAEAIEISDVYSISSETVFKELDEWSSISIMLVIAFFDEEFDKQIGDKEIKKCNTIQDLYNLATA